MTSIQSIDNDFVIEPLQSVLLNTFHYSFVFTNISMKFNEHYIIHKSSSTVNATVVGSN